MMGLISEERGLEDIASGRMRGEWGGANGGRGGAVRDGKGGGGVFKTGDGSLDLSVKQSSVLCSIPSASGPAANGSGSWSVETIGPGLPNHSLPLPNPVIPQPIPSLPPSSFIPSGDEPRSGLSLSGDERLC